MITPRTSLPDSRVVERIGEGEMGAVGKATGSTVGGGVAIEVLPADFAGDAGRLARSWRPVRGVPF